MARVLVGTVKGLSFYADDSLGLDESSADEQYGARLQELIIELGALGATATIGHLRDNGRIVVWPANQLDDPRTPKDYL